MPRCTVQSPVHAHLSPGCPDQSSAPFEGVACSGVALARGAVLARRCPTAGRAKKGNFGQCVECYTEAMHGTMGSASSFHITLHVRWVCLLRVARTHFQNGSGRLACRVATCLQCATGLPHEFRVSLHFVSLRVSCASSLFISLRVGVQVFLVGQGVSAGCRGQCASATQSDRSHFRPNAHASHPGLGRVPRHMPRIRVREARPAE